MNAFDFCAEWAKRLGDPKVILGEAGPYLSRWTVTAHADGSHDYLHYFHRGDVDRECHNHPWVGSSMILAGGYIEERRIDRFGSADLFRVQGARDIRQAHGAFAILERSYEPGSVNILDPDTFHRVDLLDPVRGCWTLFRTGPKAQSWGFWDRDTGTYEPWRKNLARRGLLGRHPTEMARVERACRPGTDSGDFFPCSCGVDVRCPLHENAP